MFKAEIVAERLGEVVKAISAITVKTCSMKKCQFSRTYNIPKNLEV